MEYSRGLDHLRALAAFMVFNWHFFAVHFYSGIWTKTPDTLFLFSAIIEGHTGVSLFMCLSGYIFAKIVRDRKIIYWRFLTARALRIFPLLVFVMIIQAIITSNTSQLHYGIYINNLLSGFVKPTWPNGGWSITVELHFYLLLPVLLLLSEKTVKPLIAFLIIIVCLSILAYKCKESVTLNSKQLILSTLLFLYLYSLFLNYGGFKNATTTSWFLIPYLEAIYYSLLIVSYDKISSKFDGKASRFFAFVGKVSYSIYLLHFFFFVNLYSAFYKYGYQFQYVYDSIIFSIIAFFIFLPIPILSYYLIEKPFLYKKALFENGGIHHQQ